MDPKSGDPQKRCPWLGRQPFPYQAYGAYLLLEQEVAGYPRLLADEMGLGKVGVLQAGPGVR